MSGFPLILAFVAAIVLMILAISKWKIHPFLSIMGISLVLGLVAGVPLVNRTAADGAVTPGLANVIGSGFSGTFTSIGIVIILGALIGKNGRSWLCCSWAGWFPSPCSVIQGLLSSTPSARRW